MYTCIYICIHMYTFMCVQTHVFTCINLHALVNVYWSTHTCIHVPSYE